MRQQCKSAISALAITAATFAPGTALADLSADQVWESWQSYIETFGYQIDIGSEDQGDNTVILRDLAMELLTPDANIRFSIETLEFRGQDDGSVAIIFAPDMPISMTAAESTGQELDMTMVLRQVGTSIVATGDEDAITYDYAADEMTLGFDKFIIEGEAIEPVIAMLMQGLTGTTTFAGSDPWELSGESSVASVDFDMSFEDPENGNSVSFNLNMADLTSMSAATMPAEIDATDPTWVFSDAVTSVGVVTTGPMQMKMDASGEDAFMVEAASLASNFHFELANGSIAYGGASFENTYAFAGQNMPFPPINVSIDETALEFAIPIQQAEEPQDFRFVLRLLGLNADEFLWQMFDPNGMLPHDPASIVIDTSGKIRTLINLADPAAMENMEAPPFEINELAINEILLSIAGARIEGTGDFTFDNTDLVTFDGMPSPQGSARIQIFGANMLIETLMSMGILPEEQAMGARMMMGVFAQPVEGADDQSISGIEVHSDGSIFANGQQLQ